MTTPHRPCVLYLGGDALFVQFGGDCIDNYRTRSGNCGRFDYDTREHAYKSIITVALELTHMATTIRKPRSRSCELCGRQEVWSDQQGSWQIVTEDGQRAVGNPHCIHEWDITGSFTPIERTDA
mgnify:CR=1 FL=1